MWIVEHHKWKTRQRNRISRIGIAEVNDELMENPWSKHDPYHSNGIQIRTIREGTGLNIKNEQKKRNVEKVGLVSGLTRVKVS